MRFILFFLAGISLSGCIPAIHTAMCIDAKIPRDNVKVEGHYKVTLEYLGKEPISRNIECESYYDSQCSTRGNSWGYRELGQKKGWPSQMVTINTLEHGPIEFSLPSCNWLVTGKSINDYKSIIEVSGKTYFLKSSDKDSHKYVASSLDGSPKKTITINYSVKVQHVIQEQLTSQLTSRLSAPDAQTARAGY